LGGIDSADNSIFLGDAQDVAPTIAELLFITEYLLSLYKSALLHYRTFQDFHITSDAAEAFWKFFAVVRETDFKENSTLAEHSSF
jgi:hypothetical protein